MKTDKNTLDALKAAGITLVASVEAPWGGITVDLEPDDVDDFLRDRAEWYARKNGAFKSQYLDWIATCGEPRCGAKTAEGAQCKNSVSGGAQRLFDVWLQEDGGFCRVHSGPSGEKARRR